METLWLYLTLLIAGFILIGTEIFVPGGILGIFGAIAWLAAAIIGWRGFPEPWNMLSAFVLLGFGLATFIVWIRFFPGSRMGKRLSLSENSANYKSSKLTGPAVGSVGQAFSILRPAGIAIFDGKRVDVVTDGEWIEAGEAIKVSSTSGGHVSVVKA